MRQARRWLLGVGLVSGACGSPATTTSAAGTEASETGAESSASGSQTSTSESSGTETGGCEPVELELGSPPIHVAFVVEQSMYMAEDYAGPTRFEGIGEALFAEPGGIAWRYDDEALGLFAYASLGDTCPSLTTTTIETGNASVLDAVFTDLAPMGNSPAANAIEAAAEAFDEPGTIIVLSGHNPTSCVSDSLQDSVFETRDAAAAAFELGIETRFVEVGDVADGYAQALANIGVGLPPGGPESAPWWTPDDVDQLRAALVSILAPLRSCTLSAEDVSFVEDGELACELSLEDDEGRSHVIEAWTVPAPGVFELSGSACQAYREGAKASASCPCEGVL